MIGYEKILSAVIVSIFCFASPLFAAPVMFTPELFVSGQYNDNINLDTEDEVDDYITTAGLSLTGQVLWRTAGFELNYSPSYSKYDENTELDSWRHLASLYAWKDLGKTTRLELRNTYLETNDPGDESNDIDPENPALGPAIEADTNRRGRNKYYTNTTETRLTKQFGVDDSFFLAYVYSILKDIDPPSGEPVDDNNISTPSAGINFHITPKWGIGLDASYAMSDYEDDNDRNELNGNIRIAYNISSIYSTFIAYQQTVVDFEEDGDEDFQIYRPSIGMSFIFPDNAGITIGAGYYIQDFETSEDDEGFNVDSSIFKTWNYRAGYFGISATSGYEIDDDGSEDNGLRIYYQGGFDAGYQLTSTFGSNLYTTYRYDDYPNETPDRADNTIQVGAGLNWQATQWLAFGLSYSHTNVTSDDPTNEYTENRATLTISMAPSRPFRLN